jgi:cAMP phosphodiesterase
MYILNITMWSTIAQTIRQSYLTNVLLCSTWPRDQTSQLSCDVCIVLMYKKHCQFRGI